MLYSKSGICLDKRAFGTNVGGIWKFYVQDMKNNRKWYMQTGSSELVKILTKKKQTYKNRFKILGKKKWYGKKVYVEII